METQLKSLMDRHRILGTKSGGRTAWNCVPSVSAAVTGKERWRGFGRVRSVRISLRWVTFEQRAEDAGKGTAGWGAGWAGKQRLRAVRRHPMRGPWHRQPQVSYAPIETAAPPKSVQAISSLGILFARPCGVPGSHTPCLLSQPVSSHDRSPAWS